MAFGVLLLSAAVVRVGISLLSFEGVEIRCYQHVSYRTLCGEGKGGSSCYSPFMLSTIYTDLFVSPSSCCVEGTRASEPVQRWEA